MLSGAGKDITLAIQALAKAEKPLRKFMAEGEFEASNISNMLGGAGKSINVAVKALVLHAGSLNAFVRNGFFCFKCLKYASRIWS